MKRSTDIIVKQTASEVAEYVADLIVSTLEHALKNQASACLVLAGGATFRHVYATLAEKNTKLDWSRVHLFFGDERMVPTDNELSNYGMAHAAWLHQFDHASKKRVIHRIRGEATPKVALDEYRRELLELTKRDAVQFDLVLLGVGLDGHTASIFASSLPQSVSEDAPLVLHTKADQEPFVDRITLSARAINEAKHIVIVATGENKRDIMHKILNAPPSAYPIQWIRSKTGTTQYVLDQAASSLDK